MLYVSENDKKNNTNAKKNLSNFKKNWHLIKSYITTGQRLTFKFFFPLSSLKFRQFSIIFQL